MSNVDTASIQVGYTVWSTYIKPGSVQERLAVRLTQQVRKSQPNFFQSKPYSAYQYGKETTSLVAPTMPWTPRVTNSTYQHTQEEQVFDIGVIIGTFSLWGWWFHVQSDEERARWLRWRCQKGSNVKSRTDGILYLIRLVIVIHHSNHYYRSLSSNIIVNHCYQPLFIITKA